MPQITIELSKEQAEALQHLVAIGAYADSNQVLSAALDDLDLRYRLDHTDAQEMGRVREMVQEGLASGPAEVLDPEAFLVELKSRAAGSRKLA